MGIGGIPDAVLSALKDHKDLGIHTEMFTDGVVPLVESGAINNTKKKIYRGVPDSVFIFQFLSFPLCLSNSFCGFEKNKMKKIILYNLWKKYN